MIILSIIAFLIIFSVLIVVHEFGHYYAAIKSGVKVEEFGLGMGKKLIGKQIGETEFTLNAVPFGGFVRMLGEEDEVDHPRSFGNAPLLNRMIITLAGVFMNFVLAIGLLTILFTVGTDPILVTSEDFDAAIAAGVVELQLPDGQSVTREEVLAIEDPNVPVSIVYKQQMKAPFPQSIWLATTETYRISIAVLQKAAEIPAELLTKYRVPEGLAGPVGIAEITHKVVPLGFLALAKLTALLSISLAVMNLLPIPALDGGRFVFQIVELLLKPFKIRPSQTIENYAHVGGFALLIGLLLIITWNDIVRIFF